MTPRPKGIIPVLALFFLSPMVGELLSGSSPPAEFFNPFGLLVLCALYGSGAILARELMVRWKKGWLSLLVLGAAYGIVEEGLMVKSFFDPNWIDLGTLGMYGRFAGVNWVWSVDLTIYHAVFSIAIPVLLTQRLFPDGQSRPWLSRRGLIFLSLLLGADVALGFFALTPYRPPAIPYLSAGAAVAALIGLARRLPTGQSAGAERDRAPMRPRVFLLGGFAATVGFFLLTWVAPGTAIPPLLLVGLTLVYVALVWRLGGRMARSQTLSPMQQLAAASGALGVFILLAPLQEIDPTRPDNTAGMALVGIAAALSLVILARRTRTAGRPDPIMAPSSGAGGSLPSELG
jgi:hypothetical protein